MACDVSPVAMFINQIGIQIIWRQTALSPIFPTLWVIVLVVWQAAGCMTVQGHPLNRPQYRVAPPMWIAPPLHTHHIYCKLSFGSCLRGSRRRTTLWLWGAWENSFLDFAKASHTEGVPWTTVYDKKRPSVSSSGAKKFTSKSAVPPIFLQNGVLHAAPGSASGSSWFCIRLLLCFRQKQSYGIYQIWVKSNIRIIGMAMPLSKHNWWNASSIFIIPDWSMKPLLLNRRLGFSHVDFSIASPKEATV